MPSATAFTKCSRLPQSVPSASSIALQFSHTQEPPPSFFDTLMTFAVGLSRRTRRQVSVAMRIVSGFV